MKKALFFVFLAILLCACISPAPDNNSQSGNDSNSIAQATFDAAVAECNSKQEARKKDSCFLEKAKQSKQNIAFCDFVVLTPKSNCLSQAALALEDKTVCSSATDKKIADDCFVSVAVAQQNFSVCNSVSDPEKKANCLFDIGLQLDSTEACKAIPETESDFVKLRDNCFEKIAIDTITENICGLISSSAEQKKDNCFFSIAQDKKDFFICNQITSKEIFDDCADSLAKNDLNFNACLLLNDKNRADNCIGFIAVSKGDVNLCSLIIDSNASKSCKDTIAANPVSLSACTSFSGTTEKEDCFLAFSLKTLDSNGCKRIVVDSEKADNCFSELATKTRNSAYCENVRPASIAERNNCYAAVALASFDANICEKIFIRIEDYANCFAKIAFAKKDTRFCDKATKDFIGTASSSKSYCFYYYAVLSNDEKICSKIKDSVLLEKCKLDA